MTEKKMCAKCDDELPPPPPDLVRHHLAVCESCGEVNQLLADGTVLSLGDFLQRNAMGDDRSRAAVSKPHASTVKSLLDVYEGTMRFLQFDLAAASGSLRTILTQVENRIDVALAVFAGLELASDDAGRGLSALREARELVSTLPPSRRGVPKESHATHEPEDLTKPGG